MFKKEKYAGLLFGLLVVLTVQPAEQGLVKIFPLEVCAKRVQPQHQYLMRRHLLNDVVDRNWNITELRKWLSPFCVQCIFSCALEETHLWESRQRLGGVALSELSEQARADAVAAADSKVKNFFSRIPCATLETVKRSELWQSTIMGKEPVDERDVDTMVEEVLNAISVEK